MTAYFLSVLAVLIAIIGISSEHGGGKPELTLGNLLAAVLEFAAIIAIAALVYFGRRGRWHQRWLEYRALAELLRHLRFLAHVGEYGAIYRLASSTGTPASAWVHWYVRATIREIGLPGVVLSHEYQWALLQAVKVAEIEPQIAYHQANAKKLNRLQFGLHIAGISCFLIIFAALLSFLLAWGGMEMFEAMKMNMDFAKFGKRLTSFRSYLEFFAAVLPTLGAALAGIRFTGDFEGFAERSAETAAALTNLAADITKVQHRVELSATTTLLAAIASAMTEDIAGWRSIYGRKYLEIPS